MPSKTGLFSTKRWLRGHEAMKQRTLAFKFLSVCTQHSFLHAFPEMST